MTSLSSPVERETPATSAGTQGRRVPPHGAHLDVIVQGLAVLLLELRPDLQHVHFAAGDHDSHQDLVACPLALKVKSTCQVTIP